MPPALLPSKLHVQSLCAMYMTVTFPHDPGELAWNVSLRD